MRDNPGLGEDFKITAVHIQEHSTRDFVTKWILYLATAFIMAAGVYGAYMGEFSALTAVVMAVEAPVFTILGYYFGKK